MGSSVDGKCAGAVRLALMDEPFRAKPCTVLDFFDDHWFCWNRIEKKPMGPMMSSQ